MSGRFQRAGISFSYLDEGEGPPFVFQHGLGGEASQVRALWGGKGRLICLECRGHGQTRPLGPVQSLGFSYFANDLRGLLDELRLERVALGGISMGAGVAARLAFEEPQRVAGLVLVRPAWFSERSPSHLEGHIALGELLSEHRDRARRVLEGEPDFRRLEALDPVAAKAMTSQLERPHAVEHAPVLRQLPRDRPLPTPPPWRALAMPALVIGTQADPAHPLAVARQWASALPRASLRLVTPKAVDPVAYTAESRQAIDSFLALTGGPQLPFKDRKP